MGQKNDNEGVWKGICVKYACNRSAAGLLYPVCIIVSGLSKYELQIKGLLINCHIGPSNNEVGYMCLIESIVDKRNMF